VEWSHLDLPSASERRRVRLVSEANSGTAATGSRARGAESAMPEFAVGPGLAVLTTDVDDKSGDIRKTSEEGLVLSGNRTSTRRPSAPPVSSAECRQVAADCRLF
jgi:hypothetical protein